MKSRTARTTRLGRLSVTMLTALIMVCFTIPAFAGPPTEFVKTKSSTLFNIINQPVSDARTTALKTEVRTLVDYGEMAKRSLGKHWEVRTPAERAEFLKLLEQLVELNYADRFKDKAKDLNYNVKYTKERLSKDGKRAIVNTEVDYGDETMTINYKLTSAAAAEGAFVIYDVVLDDVSMEETYRDNYVRIIEKEGWPNLIKRMKDRLKEIEK